MVPTGIFKFFCSLVDCFTPEPRAVGSSLDTSDEWISTTYNLNHMFKKEKPETKKWDSKTMHMINSMFLCLLTLNTSSLKTLLKRDYNNYRKYIIVNKTWTKCLWLVEHPFIISSFIFYTFYSLNLHLKDRSFWEYIIFFFSKSSMEVNEKLTYHFILLSIFYRRTKQTSNALLAYVPHIFILNKTKQWKITRRVIFPLAAVM